MESSKKRQKVLVTGASGYIAGHCINYLLEKNYIVRGTVRSIKDDKKIKHIREINPSKTQDLELIEADLLNPKSWSAAVQGCDYVIHVASPFPTELPKNDQELIKPAVEGSFFSFESITMIHLLIMEFFIQSLNKNKYLRNIS